MRRAVVSLAIVLLLVAPFEALAVDDTTAPVGSVEVVHDDRDAGLIRLSVPATDDLSGVATVEVSGDGITWASFAYAPEVDWSVFDPAQGGDPDLGDRTIRVRWIDGVGNTSQPLTTRLYLSNYGALEYPLQPVTGQLFAVRPIYGPGEVPPSGENCSWEIRWGDTDALGYNHYDDTFGSMFLAGKPDRGFCGAWTFTIPWVPVPQVELYFSSLVMNTEDDTWALRAKFFPAAGSTDRRIRSSNLPLVQVLPDTYTMIVGQPITYRAYPIGTTLLSTDTWTASTPSLSPYKIKYGGSTFTFTPNTTGNWLVGWSGRFRPFDLGAAYDPKARKPDYYRPNTTPPVQRIGGGTPGPTVPVTLTWSGSDQGWGIAKFRLQRSVDGGAWQSVSLPTAKTKSILQNLAPGHAFQFRVRAIDAYGNVGSWDYGPKFRPRFVGDGSSAIVYRRSWSTEVDATALGGALHLSSTTDASATLVFEGRDIAWIAERGPGKGRARVYIDGHLTTTVNLEVPADSPRRIVFRRHWGSLGTHRITIVVEGTLGHPIATLDAFGVLR